MVAAGMLANAIFQPWFRDCPQSAIQEPYFASILRRPNRRKSLAIRYLWWVAPICPLPLVGGTDLRGWHRFARFASKRDFSALVQGLSPVRDPRAIFC
jgi:hypothetical protein